jgi:hypothetical protein
MPAIEFVVPLFNEQDTLPRFIGNSGRNPRGDDSPWN